MPPLKVLFPKKALQECFDMCIHTHRRVALLALLGPAATGLLGALGRGHYKAERVCSIWAPLESGRITCAGPLAPAAR